MPIPLWPAPMMSMTAMPLPREGAHFHCTPSFPTAAEDEYYWVDLIGLEVSIAKGSHGDGARPVVHGAANGAGVGLRTGWQGRSA